MSYCPHPSPATPRPSLGTERGEGFGPARRNEFPRTARHLAVILASAWVTLGLGAVEWPGTESRVYELNRSRLQVMNQEQRRQIWQKYQEFLALPAAEQERIRRLSADLQKLPSDKRDRYRSMMDRYMRWKHTLPLYQQHILEDAASKGPIELYTKFREVQGRKEAEDRVRDYWFVPDAAPAMRKAIPKILAKLTPDEIEELDQTPPLDRTGKLFAAAQRVGLEMPGPGGLARQWLRGPLPPPDREKFKEFLQNLPREDLEALGELPVGKRARERGLFELYYSQHPDELRRVRKGDGGAESGRPSERNPRPKSDSTSPPVPDRREPTRTPGKVSIPPTD